MRSLYKNILVVILILVGISLAFALFANPFEQAEEISLSELVGKVNEEEVERITVKGDKLEVKFRDGGEVLSRKEGEAALSETLLNFGVEREKLASLTIEQKTETGFFATTGPFLVLFLPLLLFAAFFWLMFRQARAGMGQAFDFTKAKAKLFGVEGNRERVGFGDVAGLKEPKEELQEVVDFLKQPKKYLDIGARIPRGVLLVGPPGTGKTLLARAVAAESGVPFYSASGSDFIEVFVGVGSARIRDLFATAKKAGRAIVFIDELDAIGRARGSGYGGGHDEREQTLNQILVEMDGFERESGVIIIAASNRPDVLDPALLRPGRFDRRIVLDLPDVNDREETLKIHARNVPLQKAADLREVAERTPGFSGADLANLVNEAAIFAARKSRTKVSQAELLESIEKVLLGPERRSHVLSAKEKEITAYHEAGHALVAASLPHSDPVRKVSIIARGRAGGYTLKLPSEDRHLRSKAEFEDELAALMGGYAAEKLVFKDITTGPSNDLEKASEIARNLVKEYGMSKLGPVVFGERDEAVFLGRVMQERQNYSDEVALRIDKEVAQILSDALKKAEKVLRKKRKTLEKIAKVLVQKETLEREEFDKLIGLRPSLKAA